MKNIFFFFLPRILWTNPTPKSTVELANKFFSRRLIIRIECVKPRKRSKAIWCDRPTRVIAGRHFSEEREGPRRLTPVDDLSTKGALHGCRPLRRHVDDDALNKKYVNVVANGEAAWWQPATPRVAGKKSLASLPPSDIFICYFRIERSLTGIRTHVAQAGSI